MSCLGKFAFGVHAASKFGVAYLKKKKLLPPDYFTYKLLVNLQVAVKMFLFIYLIFRGVPPWGEMTS